MVSMYEHSVWNSCMEILHEILYGFVYGTLVWKSCMENMYGNYV